METKEQKFEIKCRYPMESLRDTVGRYRTKTLFYEHCTIEVFGDGTPCTPLFTIEDYTCHGLPSFKRLYIEIGDITEYDLAMSLFGSVEHWEVLKKCEWFIPLHRACKRELMLKLESEAFKKITNEGLGAKESGTRLSAFRAILKEVQDLDEEKHKLSKTARGRPTHEEVTANVKKLSEEEKRVLKDYERIGQPNQAEPSLYKDAKQREETGQTPKAGKSEGWLQ